MSAHNKLIKGAQIKAEGGRPANFRKPTSIVGQPKSGISIKTTQPKGYVSGKEHFMGTQISGPKTVKNAVKNV